MSSIVKKSGTAFAPKLKKNIVRRKAVVTSAEATPPATQKNEAEVAFVDTKSASPITPEPTQIHQDFQISKDSAKELITEEDIDPKDGSQKVDFRVIEEDEDEDDHDELYGDNDIFKRPVDGLRRKSSIHSQRRLSGISIRNKSRSSSISLSVTPRGSVSAESLEKLHVPVPIEIPVTKTGKRRKSSSVRTRSVKRLAVGDAQAAMDTIETADAHDNVIAEDEEEDEDLEEHDLPEKKPPTVQNKKISRAELIAKGIKIVFAINPDTQKLTKFRTGDFNDEDSRSIMRDIPLAPETLQMTITDIKQLPRSLINENPEYLSNVSLDVEEITMADLCSPNLPIGLVTENFELVRRAKQREQEEKQLRRKARISAKRMGTSYEEALRQLESELKPEQVIKKEETIGVEPLGERRKSKNTISLQFTTDGKIDVDPNTIFVKRGSVFDGDGRRREETNPFEKPIVSTTYSKRKHTDRWTNEELYTFYNALSTWGTDFTFISDLFPHRTRKQIKAKFNSEEKKNPELIEMALSRKLIPDLKKYADATNKKFDGIETFHEALRHIRNEYEIQKKEILKNKERALQEDAEKTKTREIERRTGSKPIQRLTRTKELRNNEEVIGTIDDKKRV